MAIFQSPKNIFQRPKFPGKSLKFRRKSDFCQISGSVVVGVLSIDSSSFQSRFGTAMTRSVNRGFNVKCLDAPLFPHPEIC